VASNVVVSLESNFREWFIIITGISTNPVSSILSVEQSKIKSELGSVESFESMITTGEEIASNLSTVEQNNNVANTNAATNEDLGTIISNEAAYQKYDFGTIISPKSAYQKYASEIPETIPTKLLQNETTTVTPINTEEVKTVATPLSNQTTTSSTEGTNDYFKNGKAKVVSGVEKYRNIVQREASKYGLQDYTDVILSLIMQESSGRVSDVMQSSESAGLKPNTIKDPEQSIIQGIKHFASVFKSADSDIPLTLQAYNYGGYFIKWMKKNGFEGYSAEGAQQYSNWLKKNYGMTGDPKYVEHVLRYYEK